MSSHLPRREMLRSAPPRSCSAAVIGDGRPRTARLRRTAIWAGEGSELEDFSQPDRQTLGHTFYASLVEELSQDFQMVDELGPGVLQVARLADRLVGSPEI